LYKVQTTNTAKQVLKRLKASFFHEVVLGKEYDLCLVRRRYRASQKFDAEKLAKRKNT